VGSCGGGVVGVGEGGGARAYMFGKQNYRVLSMLDWDNVKYIVVSLKGYVTRCKIFRHRSTLGRWHSLSESTL
jgi:hypothetical protein